MHPDRLLDDLTAYQISEWEAFNRIHPFELWVEDFRMAFLSSLITNIAIKWGAGKKQVKLTEITDFMPEWDVTAPKEIKRQSAEDMLKIFKDLQKAQERKSVKKNETPPVKLKNKNR